MRRKLRKKEELDDYIKEFFKIFLQPKSRMILSPELRKFYFYEFPFFITPTRMSYINGFGNIIYSNDSKQEFDAEEPLVEVIESDKTVSITIELLGILEENIELEITQKVVVIKVNNETGNYYKQVDLPCTVDADSVVTSFQNGILDIELKKIN